MVVVVKPALAQRLCAEQEHVRYSPVVWGEEHNTKATQAKSGTFREQLTVVEVEVEVPKIFFL